MIEREITVINKAGVHARPSAMIVKTASQFDSEVFLSCDGTEVNAKSIMSVMMLAAAQGSVVKIKTEGSDEMQAADAIAALFASKFNEE
ncbi:HPr family phosphocarrier protein [bacterium]|nr:HPr family phosphocarrier protein [bacterium]NUN44989.1 HPr family phosphocarrier protein [bacterium]HMW34686.1 HPr family phosphocarrier protein [bacterium]HMW36114.1 HPr family phosphocarrier protein [bacterium]HMZ03050.1 HPr family phosphocarrier protein [bacterium]